MTENLLHGVEFYYVRELIPLDDKKVEYTHFVSVAGLVYNDKDEILLLEYSREV